MYKNRTFECLKATIEHLWNEKPIQGERVAILVCPPLSKKRFEKENRDACFISQQFTQEKEFVKNFTKTIKSDSDWKTYQDEIALYALKHLLEIEENSSATVIPDVKYRHFKKALRSGCFDVIFIIAHHIIPKKKSKDKEGVILTGKIEFADGGIPLEQIQKFLAQLYSDNKISLIFTICKTNKFQQMSYGLPSIGSIATAFWDIDFVDGIEFVKCWSRFLNGKQTLSQAYYLAIDEFLKDLT